MGMLAAMAALSCSRATEPESGPRGTVVFHFAPATEGAPSGGSSMFAAAAPGIDSVVVRVFHPGTPIQPEASKSAKLGDGPIELRIDCIAENGKRVSVNLYDDGVFTHHGYETDVNVVAGSNTEVAIDAYDFEVALLAVLPVIVVSPGTFNLSWEGSPAAERFRVQCSPTPDFEVIQWEQTVTDTFTTAQLPNGSHYFRVIPQTDFANGQPCDTQFGYTRNGTNDVNITGFGAPAGIPGDVMTIIGENLDYPGTQAWIGARPMTIVSVSWGTMQAVIPLLAVTETVTVTNGLGSDTSGQAFIVQRVAYVTGAGTETQDYLNALREHENDFGFSGVAALPLEELDTRDMSVFDVIIVAEDTGTSLSNWGGGVSARANAIANTDANVVAMGRGGAVFLDLTGASTAPYVTAPDPDGKYYIPSASPPVVSTPHSVGAGLEGWNDKIQPSTTHFQYSAAPAGVNLYATRDCNRLLSCLGPTDEWVMADFRFDNPSGDPVIYFFWGYGDDASQLMGKAKEFLGNIMFMLYRDRWLRLEPTSVSNAQR